MLCRPVQIVLALTLCASAAADSLDDYIKGVMKEQGIPAIVYGIFKDGKVLKKGAYGHADLELGVKATTDNVFEIGSVSKQFTATLLLKLVEQGKVGLDDRIDKYLDNLPETWRPTTIRQLLNHTSGIPDIEAIFGYDSYRSIYTFQQIIDIANSKPLEFPQGSKWHYSNTTYYLLAVILEKVTGKSYDQQLKEVIFTPLGMKGTRQSDPFSIIPNRAKGYQPTNDGWANRDAMQPSACLGAGTIVSTIEDMAKWDAAINKNAIISAASQKMMWEPTKLTGGEVVGYGFGWFTDPFKGHPSVEHSGGTAGYSCDYRRFHDSGVSIMVFCNLYATGVEGILVRAMDTVVPGLSYASAKPIPEIPAMRKRFLDALANLAAGGATSSFYTANMWKQINEPTRAAWKQRLAGLKSFTLVEQKKYMAEDSGLGDKLVEDYVYRFRTAELDTFIRFRLTADGLIGRQQRMDN
jgi:CubicO group peptidase (beta-lactamase class C family)